MRIGRYRAVLLKLTVSGRLREKSIVGGRLRKKKGKGRRKRGKEEEEKKKYLARAPSPPAGRPQALAARGQIFSPRGETERLQRGERDRGN
ncbi:hypothetical protein BHE74_00028195, partial [Ensete ventricosum]